MLLGFSATWHLKLCIWSRACVRNGRITFISINDKSSNCENKTKNINEKWSNYGKAISYPRIILQVTHSLCFILYLFFSFIIVCSGRFCGLIMCALKFWNSAGKVLITITKLCHFMCTKLWSHMATFNPGVEMYVRETCQMKPLRPYLGGGGGSGMIPFT